MSDKPEDDGITTKQAAEYVKPEIPADKREREVKNGTATLDAMLAASRHGKVVKRR